MAYAPLTPSLRADINDGFEKTISELKNCEPNALINVQMEALKTYQKLINGLPDGYPMPLQDRK